MQDDRNPQQGDRTGEQKTVESVVTCFQHGAGPGTGQSVKSVRFPFS